MPLRLSFALQVLGLLILLSFAKGALSLAPRVPTRSKDLELIDELCSLRPGQNFVEFGSGNGRVSSYIATHNPQAHISGLEVAFPVLLRSRCSTWFRNQKNAQFYRKDGFKYDFSDTDVIYSFALPEPLEKKLKPKLIKEMKPGAKFISYVFEIKDREGGTIQEYKSRHNGGKMYVYEKM